MIRLGKEKASRRIVLRCGVMLTVRPVDAITWSVTQQAAGREALRIVQDHLETVAAGGVGTLPDAVDSEDYANAIGHICFARALAIMAIEDWDGPGDMDGNPVPVEAQWIRVLFERPGVSEDFLNKMELPREALHTEGKGSGVSQNGGHAAAPNTAGGAATSGSPAPAANPA